MLESKAVKTNEEIYKTILEEKNLLPNVLTLEGLNNLVTLETRTIPTILYDIGNSIREFEAIAYEEVKTYSIDQATDYFQKAQIIETRLILFMANGYLNEKYNFPVDYYINTLKGLKEYLHTRS